MRAALLCAALLFITLSHAANPYCGAALPVLVPAPSGYTIAQVSLVTRHGSRAPANVLPFENATWICGATDIVELVNQPISDLGILERNTYISPVNGFSSQIWEGNCTIGQLTLIGAAQHYAMGQALRAIYIDQLSLLGQYYSPSDVYIRSLDVWRGQQSAEANLLGLYPFAQRRGEVPLINIMPAPIETMNTPACAEAGYLIASQMQTSQWAAQQTKMAPLYDKLNAICGTSTNSAWNGSMGIDHFFDMLMSRTCEGVALPCSNGNCIDSSDVSAVQIEGNWEFNYLRSADGYGRASVGAFVQEMTDFMQRTTQQSAGPKYAFYSADDDTVGALLAGFDIQDGNWPAYASNLIFETWQNSGSYYVRVLYNGAVITLPACSGATFCPFNTFYTAASNLFLSNIKECTPPSEGIASRYANPSHASIARHR